MEECEIGCSETCHAKRTLYHESSQGLAAGAATGWIAGKMFGGLGRTLGYGLGGWGGGWGRPAFGYGGLGGFGRCGKGLMGEIQLVSD
ncbi:hypothetical protein ACTXT7_007971 [Hymenolepis weldensis]